MAAIGAKLRIEQPTVEPWTARVWLNGQEITTFLQAITVRWGAREITEAELTITIDRLEIDTQTLALLTAHVEEQAGT